MSGVGMFGRSALHQRRRSERWRE
ncbi:hypothetical protein [uncultured Sphingomonas sp.]